MKKIFPLIFLSLCFGKINSQRANYWYFGSYAGLNFNSVPPTILSNGNVNMPDNASTISDQYGNLLFYTNGSTVWNKNHSVMANGSGLTGNTSGGQCAVIVPQPCNPDKYVIFHTTEYSSPGYLSYSVVDMSLNGGLGGVVVGQKNVSLGTGWTEKLCAYYNSSGNNYWVLSHKWNSSDFVAFSVTSTSIAAVSVTTSIGSTYTCGTYGGVHDAMGQLTISPDGTKVFCALTCQDKYEIFQFNSATGALSNSIAIAGNGGNAWGTAFSSDSKKIYTNSIFGQTIHQYDITAYSSASIAATHYTVATVSTTGYNFGYMELGPDNKLYISKPSASALSVINNPTATGSSCNFSIAGQSLGLKSSTHGLSRIAYNIPIVTASLSSSTICPGNSATLTGFGASSFTWQPGALSGSVLVVSPTVTTIYTLSGQNFTSCPMQYTVQLNVATTPTVSISPGGATLCPGTTTVFTAGGAAGYTWYPGGSTAAGFTVTPSGPAIYSVTGTNNTCTATQTVGVVIGFEPTITATGSLTCLTPTMLLSVNPVTAGSYSWSGPAVFSPNTAATAISAPGIYTVTVTNTLTNCSGASTISISSSIGPLSMNVTPDNPVKCSQSGPVTMTATGATTYTWLPVLSTSPGTGSVVTTSPVSNTSYTVNGATGVCNGSAVITITVIATPTVIISGTSPTVCPGTPTILAASGAGSYTWYPGGATGSAILVVPIASVVYTVIGSSGSCTAPATASVSVMPSPTIVPAGSPSSVCQGISTTVSASGAVSYTWLPGNLSGSSHVLTPSVTTIYSVSGTNSLGCVSTSTLLITVIPNPTITVNPASPSLCAGNSATVSASGASTYTWNPGNLNSQLITVSPSVSTIYSVSGTLNGCTDTKTVTVSVIPNPTVFAVNFNPTICAGSIANLGSGGATSYTWLPGPLTGSGVVVSPPVTTVYTVTGVTSGCSSSATVQVVVIPGPVLSPAASPTVVCAGSASTLTAMNAQSYTWQPGNLSGATQAVTPSVTTVYTVSGTNASGCASTSTVQIIVNQYPALVISPFPSTICAGNSVTLAASGAGSYTWSPVGVFASSVVVTPSSTSVYTVNGMTNNCVTGNTLMVTLFPSPTITAAASSTNICSGATVTLTATGASSYTWIPGNMTGSMVTVSPSAPTMYQVVGAAGSCTAQASVVVIPNPPPVIYISASNNPLCFGATAVLTASGAISYTWQPGNLTGASQTVTPASTTVYTVTGIYGGCSSTATILLTVNPNPTVTISPPAATVCLGSAVSLTASGAASYTWMPGNITSSVFAASPTVATVYTVVGKTSNCAGSSTVSVAVQPVPYITISPGVSTICAGSSLTLSANGAASYTWLPVNITGSAAIVSPSATTIYTVTGTLGTCTTSASSLVNVAPLPALQPAATPSVICLGSSSTLTANNANTYSWLPGNLSGGTVVVTPGLSTSFTVTGINSSGCSSSSVIIVLVSPVPTLSVLSPSSTSSSVSICPGNTVSLVASGAAVYTWQPASSLSNSTGASVIASPSASTIYTVTGMQGNCVSSKSFTVFVDTWPTLTITTTASTICPGYSVVLTAFGSGTTFTWMPGGVTGGSISVSPTVTSTYSLISITPGGCTVVAQTITVYVLNTLNLNATASATQICAGQSVFLTATGAAVYTWMPGNMQQSAFAAFPLVSTVYTVTGATSICSATQTLLISVKQPPVVSAAGVPPVVCSGKTVGLIASGASSYQWLPGGNTGAFITVTPSVSTAYTVTGLSVDGCSASAVVNVTVVPGPTISAFSTPSVICAGAQAVLTASGTPVLLWQPPNLAGSTQSVNPASTTVYTVTGTSTTGCTGTQTLQVIVNPIPQISISSPASLLCAGESVTLSASGAVNYTWSPLALQGPSVIVTPFESVTYAVAGESLGCTGYASIHLSVAQCSATSFGVTNAASEPELYNGNAFRINFTVTVKNASVIDMTGIKLDDDLLKTFVSPCGYTVTGAPVIRSAGSSLRINSAFNGYSDRDLLIASSSTLSAKKRDTLTFSVLVEPNGFYGTLKNSVIGFAGMGTIKVSDSSNNGFAWDPDNDGDPTNNNEVTPIQIPFISLFIPEGFSPNGDGSYDYFEVKGTEGRPVKFTVFNRWGDAVYESHDTKVLWDGRANKGMLAGSGKLPAATYYYIFEFQDGKKEVRSGFIVLQY